MSMDNQVRRIVSAACLAGCAQVCASGRINAVQVISNTVEITVSTSVGKVYQVESSASLTAPAWGVSESPFQAASNITRRVFAVTETPCFYRVLRDRAGTVTTPPVPVEDPPPLPE